MNCTRMATVALTKPHSPVAFFGLELENVQL